MKKHNIVLSAFAAALAFSAFTVPASAASISASKAKTIALEDARVKASRLDDYEVEKDTYKGKAVYSIEFDADGVEYEYEIQRSNGKILNKEVEGKVSNANGISTTKAKKIVLADAKVKESKVKDYDIERDVYKTVNSYSIEFEVQGVEYDYEVSIKSGKILKKKVEGKVSNADGISVTKVKKIAFADAKVSESEVSDLDVDREVYKTVNSYNIEFEVDGVEYEYEISRKSGKILNKKTEGEKVSSSISKSKAKSIALKDAGLSASEIKDYDIEADTYKGKAVYSIDFEYGNTEYEYEIQRSNGKILNKEVEKD